MSRMQLNDEVMQYFEDAMDIVKSRAEAPLHMAALTSVVLEVGEAICLQLEKTRLDLIDRQNRIEQMIERKEHAAAEEG